MIKHLRSVVAFFVLLCVCLSLIPAVESRADSIELSYTAYVQTYGWQKQVLAGKTAGIPGQAKRIEAVALKVRPQSRGGIKYRVCLQQKGWSSWAVNGAEAGAKGEKLRVEAIQIKLTGDLAAEYDVYYRVYMQSIGWLGWVKNGETAGSQGLAKRMEGFQVRLVPKGPVTPKFADNTSGMKGLYNKEIMRQMSKNTQVTYASYVNKIGWQTYVVDGGTSGSVGYARRIEAFRAKLITELPASSIQYVTYIHGRGWADKWSADGAYSGTKGQSLQIEALAIRLKGFVSDYYDVYYRVYATDLGWMGWTSNGLPAGTFGYDMMVEAVEVKLVEKGGPAPGDTYMSAKEYKYSNSSLVSHTRLSPNNSGQKVYRVERITPHCVVGQCSVEVLGELFSRSSYEASSNYGIGYDGRIGMYVEEKDRSWCSSSWDNDQRAITIECASADYEPYAFRPVVFERLVELCTDICRRYEKKKLLWFSDREYSINYTPRYDEMVLSVHRWFAAKSCPGDWMYARMGLLAERVTAALNQP